MEYVIANLIRKHGQDSWVALERRIERANEYRIRSRRGGGKQRRCTIDRRKLRDLADPNKNVSLSRWELELIDRYLIRQDGIGLAEQPIFERRSLFGELSASDKVTFFLGVRWNSSLRTDFIPRWDVSALNALKDGISAEVETETIDIATRDTERAPLSGPGWRGMHRRTPGQTVVSIASPVSSASSEHLLAEMFGVPAYKEPRQDLPIHFLHSATVGRSAFSSKPRKDARRESLRVDGRSYEASRTADYGVVIAARTGPDTVAFVVAGNTGPATYAAAECFANDTIGRPLPEYVASGAQPVLVTLVRTKIRTRGNDRGVDSRMVSDVRIEGEPMVFRHSTEGWRTDAD